MRTTTLKGLGDQLLHLTGDAAMLRVLQDVLPDARHQRVDAEKRTALRDILDLVPHCCVILTDVSLTPGRRSFHSGIRRCQELRRDHDFAGAIVFYGFQHADMLPSASSLARRGVPGSYYCRLPVSARDLQDFEVDAEPLSFSELSSVTRMHCALGEKIRQMAHDLRNRCLLFVESRKQVLDELEEIRACCGRYELESLFPAVERLKATVGGDSFSLATIDELLEPLATASGVQDLEQLSKPTGRPLSAWTGSRDES